MNWLEIYHVMMMKELYDISMLFKMFKKFEKVVQGWKNWEKWAKIAVPESPFIHYYQQLLPYHNAFTSICICRCQFQNYLNNGICL